MKTGYACGSTINQNRQSRYDALIVAEYEKISSIITRPKLNKLLTTLGVGDGLVIVRLDRLGRSLSHLIEMVG